MVEVSCVLAALLMMTSNVLKIVYYANIYREKHGDWNWEDYKQLDPDYLAARWVTRIEEHPLFMASGILNAVAWLMMAYPIIQMAWVLSKQGTRAITLNVLIGVFVLFASMTEFISNLTYMGMQYMSEYVVNRFVSVEGAANFARPDAQEGAADNAGDKIGWRMLELHHMVARGLVTYVDSVEWICLALVLFCTYASVRGWLKEDRTSFGARWNILGLFIGFVCILEFAAEIIRFEEHMRFSSRIFHIVSILYAIVNRLIFIPAWLISLGYMLPRATMKSTFENPTIQSEVQLSDIQPAQAEVKEQFTIGDDDEDTPAKEGEPVRSN